MRSIRRELKATEMNNPSVSYADSSLYTREPLGKAALCRSSAPPKNLKIIKVFRLFLDINFCVWYYL